MQHDQRHSRTDVASLHDQREHLTLLQPRRLQVNRLPAPQPPASRLSLTLSLPVPAQILGAGLPAHRRDAGDPPV